MVSFLQDSYLKRTLSGVMCQLDMTTMYAFASFLYVYMVFILWCLDSFGIQVLTVFSFPLLHSYAFCTVLFFIY